MSKPVAEFIHPDDRERFVERQQKSLEGEELSQHHPFRLAEKNGHIRWVELNVASITWEGEPATLYFLNDVTERRRTEEELIQARKMEAIGTLAGGVAHDFNNLLTAIMGYTGILLYSTGEGDPLRKHIEAIKKAASRGASLTRQLLAFSRRQLLQPQMVDINAVVAHMGEMLRRLIREDIHLTTALGPELDFVEADPGQIEQVIMNLAINARDAIPRDGQLTIKTENVALDKEDCKRIPEARPGQFVCLSVADTGVGIDQEVMPHVFEPFFTTKGVGDGTGLGLSVVYGIVKQHEGWINVYSEPDLGSTFKVYLPAFPAKPAEESEEPISIEALRGRGERILVVEDEEEVREFVTRVLDENGYEVFGAASAKETLDIFEREQGEFHLVFGDVVLPDKTGLELVDELLARNPELRVLLGSGYTDGKSQWPVIRERGFRFLQKPYGLSDLLRAIRESIEPS